VSHQNSLPVATTQVELLAGSQGANEICASTIGWVPIRVFGKRTPSHVHTGTCAISKLQKCNSKL
jgi:hypothetical protein